jgi:glyoxylase-like metal-dependent hydrolase (beta-lactamase superfamily II)
VGKIKVITKPLGIGQANCYILIDESTNKSAVIDPGECSSELLDSICSNNAQDMEYILLTHGHYDHILGVAKLKKLYPNAKIAIHELDAVCLQNPEYSTAKKVLGLLASQEPVSADIELQDNDVLEVGSLKVRVMHTPGHTPGGLCYICNDIIFTGDTLFCKTIGRTDFARGSMDDMMKSISRLGNLPGDYTVYPGHNRSTTLDVERKQNRYMRKIEWS